MKPSSNNTSGLPLLALFLFMWFALFQCARSENPPGNNDLEIEESQDEINDRQSGRRR